MNPNSFPSLGFAAGQVTTTPSHQGMKVAGGRKEGRGETISVQALFRADAVAAAATQEVSPFAVDAVADAAMRWIPTSVVKVKQIALNTFDSKTNKWSSQLVKASKGTLKAQTTTVYTCNGHHCRSMGRQRQFGRAAECLEHLAQEEGFKFFECKVAGCGEWIWEKRMQDHCAHAHPAQLVVKKVTTKAQRKAAARKAAAAATPGRISLRTNGWTKAGSSSAGSSDSGVSSAASSPAPERKAAPAQVKVLRKKVMAWSADTMAARSAPLVVKKHYCTNAACATSSRSFKSAEAVADHMAHTHTC